MRVLSFDQSTKISGWAIFEDGKYCEHGKIDLHKEKDAQKRFHTMEFAILDLIKEKRPDTVLIEDVVLQRSPAVMKMLSQLQGIIIGYCDGVQIPIHIYYPTAWRKLLSFKQAKVKREGLKQQAIDLVLKQYNIVADSDEADAICIGMAHAIKQSEENKDVQEN